MWKLLILLVIIVNVDGFRLFQPGQEYLYEYETSLGVNTNGEQQQGALSGVFFKGTVKFQAFEDEVRIKMYPNDDLRSMLVNGKYDTGNSIFENNNRESQFYERDNVEESTEHFTPFSIKYEDGKVTEITIAEEAPNYVKNIQKAFASSFQIDLQNVESEKFWYSTESMIFGNCEVAYNIEDQDENTWLISKTVSHLSDCSSEDSSVNFIGSLNGETCGKERRITPKMFSKMFSNPERRYDDIMEEFESESSSNQDPVSSASWFSMQVEKMGDEGLFKVHKFVTNNTIIIQPFKEGVNHMSMTSRVLTLIHAADIEEEILVDGESSERLTYDWLEEDKWDSNEDLNKQENFYNNEFSHYQNFYGEDNQIENDQEVIESSFYIAMQDFIESYTSSVVTDKTKESISNLHTNGILSLTPYLMKMNYDTLFRLKERFFSEAEDMRNGQLAKNLFRELVSASGSKPSAMLVKEMVMKQEYENDVTAARELLSIPFHVYRPTQNLVEEFKELNSLESGSFVEMAAPLAYSTLVRKTCERNAFRIKECEENLLTPAIEEAYEEFENVDVDDRRKLNRYMAMFINYRFGGIAKLLKPLIYGKTKHENLYSIRAKAIQAVASEVINKGMEEEYFLPLIMDEHENHEIRIMAFNYMMQGEPTETTFIKLVTAMYWERDYEVFNYIYTSFEKYALATNELSCGSRTQERARYFLKYWKEHMWLRPKYTFGISKAYSRKFIDEKFGFGTSFEYNTIGSHKASSPLALFGQIKGIQFQGHEMQILGFYIRVQGLGGRIMKLLKDFDFFNKKDQLNTEALKTLLFEKMNMREKRMEPLQLEIVLSMKDNVIFQQYWDEESVGTITEFVKNAMEMWKENDHSFSENRVFNFPTMIYEIPTELGMPIGYDIQASLLGSFNAEIDPDDEAHEENIHKVRYSTRFNFQSNNGLSLFYSDKLAFTVRQDRVYKHSFGNRIKFGAESRDEENRMVLALDVPEQGNPFSLLMHSQTILEILPNKFADDSPELRRRCPTCHQKYVLSGGENSKKQDSLFDLSSEELGIQVKATYFDCEAKFASSKENLMNRISKFFSMENKSPKDFYTAATLGLVQLDNFFMYFPYAESCGMSLEWLQSAYNPINEVRLSFRGLMDKSKKNGGGTFRFNADLDLIGDIIRQHVINFKYEYENDRPNIHTMREVYPKQEYSLKLKRKQFELGAFNVPDYSICADFANKMSVENDKYFFMDLNSEQKTLTGGAISFGPSSNCGANDHKIRITGKSSTTEEARNHLKSKWYYYTCMEQKKSKEFNNFPLTDACFYTAEDLFTLRHFQFDVETINLPLWLKNGLYKVETFGKYYLLPYWEMKMETMMNGFTGYNKIKQDQKVQFDLLFNSAEKTVDFKMKRMNQQSEFKGMKYWTSENNDVSINDYLPSSSFSSPMEVLNDHNIFNYCTASSKNIRTFDNVTYSYEMHDCWTLVSAHCASDPEYAVFMKKDQYQQMALMVYIGGHKVEIVPSSSSRFDITVNEGNPFDLSKDDTYYFPSGNVVANGDEREKSYMFKIYKWESTFTIDSFLRMTLHYDGSHVSVISPPHVKGQQCGMCGDFNRDHRYEMLGPNECQLKNGNDMAKAWAWDKEGSGECPNPDEDCEFSEENYFVKQT